MEFGGMIAFCFGRHGRTTFFLKRFVDATLIRAISFVENSCVPEYS